MATKTKPMVFLSGEGEEVAVNPYCVTLLKRDDLTIVIVDGMKYVVHDLFDDMLARLVDAMNSDML